MTRHPHFWTGDRIDHQARGGPTPNPHGQPGDEPGSLRSADGRTQDHYSARAGSVERTAGIRSVDPAIGAAQILVGAFALFALGLACVLCRIPQWIAAWVVTW